MNRHNDDLIDFPVSSTWARHYERLGDIDFAVSPSWASFYAGEPERKPVPIRYMDHEMSAKVYADRILALEARVFRDLKAKAELSRTVKGIEIPTD